MGRFEPMTVFVMVIDLLMRQAGRDERVEGSR
jgi:hypothetical protein